MVFFRSQLAAIARVDSAVESVLDIVLIQVPVNGREDTIADDAEENGVVVKGEGLGVEVGDGGAG